MKPSTGSLVTLSIVVVVVATIFLGPQGWAAEDDNALTDPSTEPAICRNNFDSEASLLDDGFYLSLDGNDDKIEKHDIRLVAFNNDEAGDLISDDDAVDMNPTADCQTLTVAYIDADSGGSLNADDWIYVGYDSSTTTAIERSQHNGDWWIRVTPVDTGDEQFDAGTLVLGGHDDGVHYAGGTILTAAEFAYHDADDSSSFDIGDWGYLVPNGLTDGDKISNLTVRLHHSTHAFGTQYGVSATTTSSSATTSSSNSTTTSSNASTSQSQSNSSTSTGPIDTNPVKNPATRTPAAPVAALLASLVVMGVVLAHRRRP